MDITTQQTALFNKFDELGIKTNTVRHKRVFTVEESKELRGNIEGGHCKSLFLKAKKGQLYLLVALEDTPINLKMTAKTINEQGLSFGKPELLEEMLGITPGSVTPFALINDDTCAVSVLLDERMMAHNLLSYHPLLNDASTSISPDDLLIFIRSCGHEPRILSFHNMGD